MQKPPVTLGLQVDVGPDADPEEIAEATLQLRRELLDLDVDAVQPAPSGPPPPGTRGVELAALGALIITVTQSPLLTPMVDAMRSWLAGAPQRSIKLDLDGDVLELTGLSSADQRRLADEWLRRHESR